MFAVADKVESCFVDFFFTEAAERCRFEICYVLEVIEFIVSCDESCEWSEDLNT